MDEQGQKKNIALVSTDDQVYHGIKNGIWFIRQY